MTRMFTPPAALEALLFAAGEPMEKKKLVELLEITDQELVLAMEGLEESLKGRGLALVETDGEMELRTTPEAAPLVKRLSEAERSRDLGKAGLETLAVIAYQKGATRSDVDWVRGVNSSTSIRSLLLRGLIEGREDLKDRRRIRYALTTEALAHLGVRSLDDLPRYAELAHDTKDTLAASSNASTDESV